MYDVVVAGGSIAGLCCAREAALGGCSVLVIEDDAEVGTPDHCGGGFLAISSNPVRNVCTILCFSSGVGFP